MIESLKAYANVARENGMPHIANDIDALFADRDRLRGTIIRMVQRIAELEVECQTLMRERDECEKKQAQEGR